MQLADGRVLVFGGQAAAGSPANTVEEFNPATGLVRTLPRTATRGTGLYPRLHLMPDGTLLKPGPTRATTRFDPGSATWTAGPSMIYGNRHRGVSVLLSGGTRLLALGGHDTGTSGPTATAEILDTAVSPLRWRPTGAMAHARMLADAVLLPDGKVLVVGGGRQQNYTGPVRTPEMYDPATGGWTQMAPHTASRMYHSTAVLLPDGRVLSAGQDNGALATYGEIYSPPYLFRGARPTVSSAPAAVAYGSTFSVTTPEAAAIRRVVLIRPGSTTHQVNTDQRAVPLAFTAGAGTLTVAVPANRNLAPPGYYLLFLVDADGVPSVAPWVRLA